MYTTFPFTFQVNLCYGPKSSVLFHQIQGFKTRNERVFFYWRRRVNSYEGRGNSREQLEDLDGSSFTQMDNGSGRIEQRIDLIRFGSPGNWELESFLVYAILMARKDEFILIPCCRHNHLGVMGIILEGYPLFISYVV